MNSALTQIVKSFDELNMTVEEICKDQSLEEYVVKSALMNASSKYRALCRKEPEKESVFNFTNEQNKAALERIFNLIHSDDEHISLKAALSVRDDFKGRKDVVKAVQGNTFNILTVNEAIQKARAGASTMRQVFSS